MRIVVTRGIPGSGKSTHAMELVQQGFVRSNLDELRSMTGNYDDFNPKREKMILDMQDQIILSALRQGRDVVVDATHLNDKTPRRLALLLWEHGIQAEWEIADFTHIPTSVCRARDDYRGKTGGRAVGREVMDRMIASQEQQRSKGFWTVESIHEGLPKIVPYLPDLRKPRAYVFDIDGTLARHDTRGPYEAERCGEDGLHEHIAMILDSLLEHGVARIIACSGREERYRAITEDWIYRHHLAVDALYMRPTGDTRRDSVVKIELFDRFIRPDYNVVAWFDDRDRVVRAVRQLGIPVLQVAPGDF